MSEPVRYFVTPGGRNVFVVNRGPAGAPGPTGSPGDVVGPVSSTVGNLPLWSGTSGNLLSDSGVALTALATDAELAAGLATKQNTAVGKALSTNDFTNVLKAKLDNLSEGTFQGTFDDETMLVASLPIAVAGDWAVTVDPVPGDELQAWFWDEINGVWVAAAKGSVPSNGAEIKTALFAEADTNNLSDSLLTKLNETVSQATFDSVVVTLTGGAAPTTNVVIDATTSRSLTTTDVGKFIVLTSGSPCDIVVPDDATALWTLFPPIAFYVAAGVPTVSPAPGVTVSDPSGIVAALVTGSTFSLKKIGADSWVVTVGM